MMKILAFVGTNADFSYNRLLLRFRHRTVIGARIVHID